MSSSTYLSESSGSGVIRVTVQMTIKKSDASLTKLMSCWYNSKLLSGTENNIENILSCDCSFEFHLPIIFIALICLSRV